MRYAGFGPRFAAAIVDVIVLLPFIALSFWSLNASRGTAMIGEVLCTLVFALYPIYFVGRWGQTIGKMALRVKVVSLEGSPAGFKRAFYRASVDLAFSILVSVSAIYALLAIDSAAYKALDFEGKVQMVADYTPWTEWINDLWLAWGMSELVVLLMNKKRRALHDFIAGTVVIHETKRG